MSKNDPQINRDEEHTGREPAIEHRPGSLDSFYRDAVPPPPVPGKVRPTLLWVGDDLDLDHWRVISEESGYEVRSSALNHLCHVIQAVTPDLVLLTSSMIPQNLAGIVAEVRAHPDRLVTRVRMAVFAPTMVPASMNVLFAGGVDDILLVSDWDHILQALSRIIRYGTPPAPLTALTNPSIVVRHAARHQMGLSDDLDHACAGLRRLAQYPDHAVRAGIRAVQLQLGCGE